MNQLTWIGIVFCLSQSAVLSGLNLALFSLSKLELEVEAKKGDPRARRVLEFRRDANFSLVTILWGNVAVNVLLALLSGSVLAGAAGEDIVENDVILLWSEPPRLITGTDILGRLLRGIARPVSEKPSGSGWNGTETNREP